MDTIIRFALPGLAMALVFYILVMTVPFRDTLLRNHAYVDVIFTTAMMLLLAGTFSGAMTAAIGGVSLSILLLGSSWLFLPTEESADEHACY